MYVGLLTEEQKDWLVGAPRQLVQPDWYFNPVQDGSNQKNWVISEQEINNSIYPQNDFVKSIPLILWVPPIETIELSGNTN
jgi:hypothetical protein